MLQRVFMFLVNGSQNYYQYHSQKVNFSKFPSALNFHKHLFKIANKFNLKRLTMILIFKILLRKFYTILTNSVM